MLRSATAVKHEIRLKPGTEPVKARTYRLPESKKPEVRKQIEELKRGAIITRSISSCNSPMLVVSKKSDTTGEKRWRLVIEHRKLNEKTVSEAYPSSEISDILDHLGQSIFLVEKW